MTNCPNCGGEQHCPCDSCAITRQKEVVTWKWIEGDFIACGHCGYTLHVDGWIDVDFEQTQNKQPNAIAVRRGAQRNVRTRLVINDLEKTMPEPVKKEFMIPENCPKDIELMSIWANAYQDYSDDLTIEQIEAAVAWFKSWIDAEIQEAKN